MSDVLYQPNPSLQVSERIFRTSLPGLWFISHKVNDDGRGFFAEVSIVPDLETVISFPFVVKQMNVARSQTSVIRGFHAENWNKLVTIVRGTAYCVLADINPESASFGQVERFLLGDSPKALRGSLFISKGLANSVCVVEGPLDYHYAVDSLYRDRDTSHDQAISLFDPDFNVTWPIEKDALIISDRDLQAVTLRAKFPEKFTT